MDFNLFEFPGDYAKASLENCDKVPAKILETAKKWLNSNNKPPIVFFGNVGSTKTYLSIAIFRELCKIYPWALYVRSDDLDRQFLDASLSPEDDESRVLCKYKEVPVLIWDDLGVERASDRVQRQFYSIIDWRTAAKKPTIFTTNCTPEMMKERLGERIASRMNLCFWIQFPDVDRRLD